MDRFWRVLLCGVAAMVLAATLVRIPIFWGNEAYLDLASGVWFGLADDLAHGVFYRPVFSPEGFGGTRYFPVQILLHSGLTMVMGGHIVVAARVLTALAMLGLLSGVYVLLRRLGATRVLAASCAVLILPTHPMQEALLSCSSRTRTRTANAPRTRPCSSMRGSSSGWSDPTSRPAA